MRADRQEGRGRARVLVGRWEGGCGGRSPARLSSGGCVSSLMKKARSSSRSGSGGRSIASVRPGQPGERETVHDGQAALRAHLHSRLGFQVNPIGKAVFPYLTQPTRGRHRGDRAGWNPAGAP